MVHAFNTHTNLAPFSTPYASIKAFAVESAGAWDKDSELDIYTRNLWDLGKIQMDFRKGQVDILQIQKFLSAMVLKDKQEMTSYLESAGSAPHVKSVAGLGGFINWLGGNSVEQDATDMDKMFHSDPPLLMGSEKVEKVYKTGRDMFVYTNHRILLVDVQGLRGKKVEYLVRQHSHGEMRQFKNCIPYILTYHFWAVSLMRSLSRIHRSWDTRWKLPAIWIGTWFRRVRGCPENYRCRS